MSVLNSETEKAGDASGEKVLSRIKQMLPERVKKPVISKDGKSGWVDLFIRFKNLVSENHTETRNAKDYAAKLNGVSEWNTLSMPAGGHV